MTEQNNENNNQSPNLSLGNAAYIIFDLQNNTCTYSSGLQKLIPFYNEHSLTPQNLIDYFIPEDANKLRKSIFGCLAENRPFELLASVKETPLHKGKVYVVGEMSSTQNKSHAFFVTVVRSPDSLRKEDIEAERTKIRIKLSLAATKTGIWDWDYENDILYWDDTMFELFELEHQNFKNNFDDLKDIIHPDDVSVLQDAVLESIRTGGEFISSFRVKVPSGLKHIAARGKVFRSGKEGIWFTGINWDITKEVHQQEIIKSQEVQILSSARLSSLGEMAGGIAHEINNPLAVIHAKAEFLQKRLKSKTIDDQTLTIGLDKIIETCNRIVRIIKGLKSFSRNSEDDPKAIISLNKVINDVIGLIHEKFKLHNVRLEFQSNQNFTILGKEAQIGQVIMNLISNSFDAIEHEKEKWTKIVLKKKNGDGVEMRVYDSGQGVNKKDINKLMQPFFTTKEVGKGTGLGLSISKGIIEEHGGKLWLDTNELNTCFVVELTIKDKYEG
jgi:signal transduction histidine kinase